MSKKQRIIDYYFYKHYCIWLLLPFISSGCYLAYFFAKEVKVKVDVVSLMFIGLFITALHFLLVVALKDVIQYILLSNKKYINFLNTILIKEYDFNLKQMFEDVLEKNILPVECFKKIKLFGQNQCDKDIEEFYRTGFYPKYTKITKDSIVRLKIGVFYEKKEYIYFRNKEEFFKNKKTLIDFLSNLEIDCSYEKPNNEEMRKKLFKKINEEKKLNKDINKFLKNL